MAKNKKHFVTLYTYIFGSERAVTVQTNHTLEEIDTKKTYLENMMIVLREAVKDEKDGELVFINIMSEFLLNF